MPTPNNEQVVENDGLVDEDVDYVIKRDGRREEVSVDKIKKRIEKLCFGLNRHYVNPSKLAIKVSNGIYRGITTSELDELSAETAFVKATEHPHLSLLAGRIVASNVLKSTEPKFSQAMSRLFNYVEPRMNRHAPKISESTWNFIRDNADELDALVEQQKDQEFTYDYFAYNTMKYSMMKKIDKKHTMETVQYMFMRVAVGIHQPRMDLVKETFMCLSRKDYTHATPTLINAGTVGSQNSSCFLVSTEDDLENMLDVMKRIGLMSKYAGGIGNGIGKVRAKGSHIRGTDGTAGGVVPMLRAHNNLVKWIDQCFSSTDVLTQRGLIPVSHVSLHDKVWTNENEWVDVLQVVRHHVDDEEMIGIKAGNDGEVLSWVTSMHQVLVLPKPDHPVASEHSTVLSAKLLKLQGDNGPKQHCFMEANEITQGDFMVFPIPSSVSAGASSLSSKLSVDDCRLLGLLIGHHQLFSRPDAGSLPRTIVIQPHRVEEAWFIDTYLTKYAVQFKVDVSAQRYTWNMDQPGFNLSLADVEHPLFNQLSQRHYVSFVEGLQDATPLEQRAIGTTNKHCYVLDMNVTSRVPNNLLRTMAQRCGWFLQHDISGDQLVWHTHALPGEVQHPLYFVYKDCMYVKVDEDIEHKRFSGTVYDFEVGGNHTYTTEMGVVHNGGGKRNGAEAVYLPPWHADVFEFLDMNKKNGTPDTVALDLHYAMWIPMIFMERCLRNEDWSLFSPDEVPELNKTYGEEFERHYLAYEMQGKARRVVKAQALLEHIAFRQLEAGEPYVMFSDAANYKSNQKNVGYITNSNLCVHGDTLVLTNRGHQPIRSLENQTVNVWNGKMFSKVEIKMTNCDQSLVSVEFSTGAIVNCTPYHNFYLANGTKVSAQHLKQGDQLQLATSWPVIAAVHDGQVPDLDCEVPLHGSLEDKLRWLETRLHVCATGVELYALFHTSTELRAARLMLQTMGMDVTQVERTDVDTIKLYLQCEDLQALRKLGLQWMKLVDYEHAITARANSVAVLAVTPMNGSHNTYCFNEPLEHRGVFNGVLTGQCSEIVEYQDKDEIAVCTLGSINVPAYVVFEQDAKGNRINQRFDFERFHKVTKVMHKSVNRLIDINFYPVPETRTSNLRHRPTGLGVNGLQNGFILMGFPFLSPEARQLNKDIFETLYHGALESSWECTNEIDPVTRQRYGPYDTFVGSPISLGKLQYHLAFDYDYLMFTKYPIRTVHKTLPQMKDYEPSARWEWAQLIENIKRDGVRNSLLLAPMPTATTGQIMGNVECFTGETQVTMADGTTLRIDQVRPGMQVSAYDEATGTIVPSTVTDFLPRGEKEIIQLTFSDGRVIKCTPDHRFMMEDGTWCHARDIPAHGACVKVATTPSTLSLTHRLSVGVAQVYDINVDHQHTFLAEGIVVHNCFESLNSNIYKRIVLAGEFIFVMQDLVYDLDRLGLWNEKMRDRIILNGGSVEGINDVPVYIQQLYRTVWNHSQMALAEMAADRQRYICQSQSFNVHLLNPNVKKICSYLIYAFRLGLKTGSYYFRTKAGADAAKVTLDPTLRLNDAVATPSSSSSSSPAALSTITPGGPSLIITPTVEPVKRDSVVVPTGPANSVRVSLSPEMTDQDKKRYIQALQDEEFEIAGACGGGGCGT